MRILRAAIAYWAVVFALGFVLGTLRVLLLSPLIGLVPATLIELPVMVAASWCASGCLVRRFGITGEGAALAMGGLAFALLMAAECAIAAGMMEQRPAQWLAGLRQPHALLGLAGQVLFAVMPWLRVRQVAISA
ncbi:MAG: hypothetical protein MUF47_04420 [Porphyrobacter sp.]|jgi:hypothetical protein|nr:hypothetical protein [Porphyrobacter sp.]